MVSENNEYTKPLLPDEENGSQYVLGFEKNGEKVDININIKPRPKIEFQTEMYDKVRNFEKEAWSEKAKGIMTGFKSIDDAFDGGIKNGFILIAADSNVGKTGLLSQMAWQIADKNDDVYVMDYSLDDPMEDKISRVVACNSRVVINSVKNPGNYLEYENMLNRRKLGLSRLYNSYEKYVIRDASNTTDIEKIEEEIIATKIELEAQGINKRLVVFIDNFHDLTTRDHPNFQDKQRYEYIAEKCADIAINQKIPLVCTAEFKKMNGDFRPMLDSIRESVKIKYEAKAILLCYNEVHYKGEGASIYFDRSDKPEKQPIFEVHFAKNKLSSFKGRLFFEFYPELSYMRECNETDSKTYASKIS